MQNDVADYLTAFYVDGVARVTLPVRKCRNLTVDFPSRETSFPDIMVACAAIASRCLSSADRLIAGT
jgi:hypothetical protein